LNQGFVVDGCVCEDESGLVVDGCVCEDESGLVVDGCVLVDESGLVVDGCFCDVPGLAVDGCASVLDCEQPPTPIIAKDNNILAIIQVFFVDL